MQTDHTSIEAMRAYLLGRLPDDEAAALEEEYFVNRPFLLKLQSEETALIEDYLDGSLRPAEKQSFEKQYLQSPALLQKVEEVRRQRVALTQTMKVKPPIWTNWRFSFAAALVLVLGIGIWMYYLRGKEQIKSAAQLQLQPAKTTSPTIQSKPESAIAVYLLPGTTQGFRSQWREITQPTEHTELNLVLELLGQTSSVEATVEISRVEPDESLRLVWSSKKLLSSDIGKAPANELLTVTDGQSSIHQVLKLSLPSSLFQPGDYVVRAWTPQSTTHETYTFRVLPPPSSGRP
jgi:hypothetical protein